MTAINFVRICNNDPAWSILAYFINMDPPFSWSLIQGGYNAVYPENNLYVSDYLVSPAVLEKMVSLANEFLFNIAS